ncbi:MAG TPA: formate dehydrogenase, partial [Nitrospira sp.]|nr:formate dehydrogenase [Nitrospira sp.]
MAVTLYLSNDTSARAAGTDRLAAAWAELPDLRIVRTSTRGAFFLEPLVERDGSHGRLLWPRAKPDDLSRIRAGSGGISISDIPFLSQQQRSVFARFGTMSPLSLEEYRAN